MKKFLCIMLGMITVISMTSCMPPKRETEAQKRSKQIIAEEMAKLDEILEKSKMAETEEVEEETVLG